LGAKKEWPSWTPTKDMIARDPDQYAQYAGGMPGGPNNPLGARALYLFDDVGNDTFLRIHGTPEPWTIGSAVSNGCVRLANEDIVALYEAVEIGVPVLLLPKLQSA
jgi:lipoprotein-anchoring transpeptidase ErfK/SrfK